ncbi:MAG TPA: hypothetical protein VK638_00680 [Edaphobacter sp.]|nr:hypothetical protein [Edaphobacter sp.]
MNAKVDLSTLPKSMQALPVDERGYPVPWFVDWIDGKPEFRAMDFKKWIRAVRESLCWVCGVKMGYTKVFVAGPMCGINRTSSEPPSHPECARWSAENCPFMANPRMVRREDEVVNNAAFRDKAAGIPLTRNPGVAMLWFTRSYEVFNTGKGPLLQMGAPTAVEWYCEGRKATREEVDESVAGGMPALEAIARSEEGGMAALHKAIQRFERYLPALA